MVTPHNITALSVIITCYKEGDLIYRALNSLYNQTDTNFEIILVNDCSQDERTNLICNDLRRNKKITVIINEINLGLSGARNVAIEIMHGEIVVLLDADDVLPDNAISHIRKAFENHSEADFVFGDYIKNKDNNHQLIHCEAITNKEKYLSPPLLVDNWILLGTSSFRKSLWNKIGGYSQEFSNTCQDVDFWQRAILSDARGYYIDEVIYHWECTNSGMNSSLEQKQDFDKCNYKNVEFYFRFSKDLYKPFIILYYNKDYQQIKIRASKLLKFSYFKIVSILPIFLIPAYFKIYIYFFKK